MICILLKCTLWVYLPMHHRIIINSLRLKNLLVFLRKIKDLTFFYRLPPNRRKRQKRPFLTPTNPVCKNRTYRGLFRHGEAISFLPPFWLFDAENINWFVIYWYLVCFSLLFIWRGTNWGQNLYKNNTKKRKHNFLELSNSQNRMLTKRKRKNSLHSYHNLIPSSINSNPDSRCIECRLLEKRNYRFSLVSCIFKKVLNQTLYNFIMTDIG